MDASPAQSHNYGQNVPSIMRDQALQELAGSVDARLASSGFERVKADIIFTGNGREQALSFFGSIPNSRVNDFKLLVEELAERHHGQIAVPLVSSVGGYSREEGFHSCDYQMVGATMLGMR